MLDDVQVRVETVNHQGANGKIQVFKSICLFSRSAITSTFDGHLYSDWVLEQEGQLFVPSETGTVEYNCEFMGEDIPLKLFDCIYVPEANANTQPFMDALAKNLPVEIGKIFNASINLPFVLDV